MPLFPPWLQPLLERIAVALERQADLTEFPVRLIDLDDGDDEATEL